MKNKSKLDLVYGLLKNHDSTPDCDVKSYINNRAKSPFSDDLLATLLSMILDTDFSPKTCLGIAEKLYKEIVTDPNDKEEELLFLKIFINNNMYISDNNINLIKQLNLLFEDKEVSFMIYNLLKHSNLEYKNEVINYIKKFRMFYLDEKIFYSVISTIINKSKDNIDELDHLFNEEINIYLSSFNVDEQQLINFSNNIENISLKHQEIDTRINDYLNDSNEIFDNVKNTMTIQNDLNKHNLLEITNYVYKLKDLCSKLNQIEVTKPEFINEKVEKLLIELEKLNLKEELKEDVDEVKPVDDKKIEEKPVDGLNYQSKIETAKPFIILEKIKHYIEIYYKLDYKEELDSIMINKIMLQRIDDIDDSIFSTLCLYYFALYNNSLDVYENIINRMSVRLYQLDRKIIDKFNFKDYIYILNNNYDILNTFYNYDEIDLYAQLTKINKDYKCLSYDYIFICKLAVATQLFGIEKVASNNELFDRNIKYTDIDDLKYLKEVYDINENYEVKYDGLIALNDFFTIEEIVNLNDKQLENFKHLFVFEDIYVYYNYYINEYKKVNNSLLRKLVLTSSDISLDRSAYMILSYLENNLNFDIDEFLCLDNESAKRFLDSASRYCDIDTKINNNKLKKIIKRNKKLIDKK